MAAGFLKCGLFPCVRLNPRNLCTRLHRRGGEMLPEVEAAWVGLAWVGLAKPLEPLEASVFSAWGRGRRR